MNTEFSSWCSHSIPLSERDPNFKVAIVSKINESSQQNKNMVLGESHA